MARANTYLHSRPPRVTELRSAVGETILKIRTVAYRGPGGQLDLKDHDVVELSVASGRVFGLKGTVGEWLALTFTEWSDPFAGPQPPENEEYLRSHGRWEAFDLTNEELWVELTRAEISNVEFLEGYEGRPRGAVIGVGSHKLRVEIEADETAVSLDGRPAGEWIINLAPDES